LTGKTKQYVTFDLRLLQIISHHPLPHPPCYIYCGFRTLPPLLHHPLPCIVKHHSIVFIDIPNIIVNSKKGPFRTPGRQSIFPEGKGTGFHTQLGRQGAYHGRLGGGWAVCESGIDVSTGPDHGYGRVGYLTLGGGAMNFQYYGLGVAPGADTFLQVNMWC
jgi:hypothetical protein